MDFQPETIIAMERAALDRWGKGDPQGDVAVLTYNLASHVKPGNGATITVRWNCTEVYARIDGKWKIIHNHCSYTKPALKQPSAE